MTNIHIHNFLIEQISSDQVVKLCRTILDPYDTHLKEKMTDVKLAFTFKGILSIPQKNILGYTAVGMWKKQGGREYQNSLIIK